MKKKNIYLVEMKEKQTKYLNQLLNKSLKKTKEFDRAIMEETHNNIMKEVRNKNKVSPTGGANVWGKKRNEDNS